MKVNYTQEITGTPISQLNVGDTFLSKRSRTDEEQVYMIVDVNCGVFLENFKGYVMAVNLSTGQIRRFTPSARVISIGAEVNVFKMRG